MSDTFAADVKAFCDKAQIRSDEALRAIAIELLGRVVTRSPVGNPELWAANQTAVEGRKAAIAGATQNGRTISKGRLQASFPLTAGSGYVGGRFRGNWQVTFEAPATGPIDNIDPSGGTTLAIGSAELSGAKIGTTIYLVNCLPYAERLEFGWSKQAPAGVVRVTVAEFQSVVQDVVGGQK